MNPTEVIVHVEKRDCMRGHALYLRYFIKDLRLLVNYGRRKTVNNSVKTLIWLLSICFATVQIGKVSLRTCGKYLRQPPERERD